MEHGRTAVDLPIVTDELEARRAGGEKLTDVLVLGPVRHFRGIEFLDQVVVDEWLLHAADDVDDIVRARAPASH